MKKFKRILNTCLHNPTSPEGRIVNGLLSFLILFSIAVIPLHLFAKFPNYQWITTNLFLFDKITISIFTIEYLLRIWTNEKPLQFILSWEGVVDFVAIAPFYLEKFGIGGSLDVFLLLRILRVLKFSVMYGKEHEALERCQNKRHGELYILPNEKVEHVVQKHPLIFLLALLMPLFFITAGLVVILLAHNTNYENIWFALSILSFALAGVFFYKAWLDYQYDVIYITNFRVILQNHELFGSQTNGLLYDSITNVIPNNRGFFRWVFGLGHIEIETANRDSTIVFENAPHPHKIVGRIAQNRIRQEVARKSI